MRKKKMYRVISLILIFCLAFASVPAIAFAGTTEGAQFAPSKATAMMDESTENSTTFDLGGGVKHTTFHGEDVRFEDSDGTLTDYDPSLTKIKGDKSTLGNNLEEYDYQNKAGDSSQYFPETLSSKAPLLMEKEEYSIKMAPIDDFSFKRASLKEEERPTPYKSTKTEDLTAAYETTDGDMSIEYTSLNQGVKETVVLNEAPKSNVFSYSLDLKGLKPELSERKNIIYLKDKTTDEVKAFLDRPYMHDSSEEAEYSYDIIYSIEEVKDKKDSYLLKLTVSEDYLKDENRIYPVSIDPTAVWTGSSMMEVVEIFSYSPSTRESGASSFFVDCEGSTYTSSYMRFIGIENTLADKSIQKAELALYEGPEGSDGSEYQDISISRVTSNWNANTICWNNKPSKATPRIDYITGTGTTYSRNFIDLTDLVSGYANGTYPNYGIVFESLSSNTNVSTDFFGPESPYHNAQLEVTYTSGEPTAPTSVITYGSKYGIFNSSTYFKEGDPIYVSWSGIESLLFDHVEYKVEAAAGTNTASPTAIGDEEVDLTEYRSIPASKETGNYVCLPYTDELPDGSYTIYIRGADTSGRTGDAKSVNVVLDSVFPTLTDVGITPDSEDANDGMSVNAPTADRTPKVTWNASDDRQLSKVTISVNGKKAKTIYPSGTKNTTLLASSFPVTGIYTITVEAFDSAGNVTKENIYYSLDLEGPAIEELEITPTTSLTNKLNNVNPVVKWKVTDPFFSHIEYSVNGGANLVLGDTNIGKCAIPSSAFNGSGTYTLAFTAYDKAGNASDAVTKTYYLGTAGSRAPQNVTATEYYGKRVITWDMKAFNKDTYQFDLHKGTTSSFTPSTSTLVASNVDMTKGYYVDNEVIDAGTYYYKFTAKKIGSSTTTKSSSAAVTVTNIADSLSPKLGHKDYLSYFEFGLPTGSGYIEKSSGNMMYEQTDYTVSNAKLDYSLTRTYNSLSNITGMLGKGFSDSYHKELYKDGNTIYFVDSDGSVLTFVNTNNQYTCNESKEYKLSLDDSNTKYLLTDKEEIVYTFSLGGQLEKIEEPNGCEIVNIYDNLGRLSYVVSNESYTVKSLEFNYDGDSKLLDSVTDFEGTTYEYTYSNDILTEVKASKGLDNVSYVYGYSENGLMDKIYDGEDNQYTVDYENSKAKKVTYPNNEYYDIAYDTQTNETTVKKYTGLTQYQNIPLYEERVSFDAATGKVLTVTDAKGLVTSYSYATTNPYLVSEEISEKYYQEVKSDNTLDLNKKVYAVTSYVYDSNDNVTSETTSLKDSLESTNSITLESSNYYYDKDVTGSDNRVSYELHSTAGEVTSGYTYSYGELEENILTKGSVLPNERLRGNISSSYDAKLAVITNSSYDEVGRETNVKEYQHLKQNEISLTMVAGEGVLLSETATDYNSAIMEGDDFFTEEIQTKTTSGDTVYESLSRYDGMGRILESEENGEVTKYTYDFLGRVVRTDKTLADGTVLTTTSEYDKNGSLTSETNERGVTTTYTYDSINRNLGTVITGSGIATSEKWTSYDYSNEASILSGNGLTLQTGMLCYKETVTDDETGGNVLSVKYISGAGDTVRDEVGTSVTLYQTDKSGNSVLSYILEAEEATLTLFDKEGRNFKTIKNPEVSGNIFAVTGNSVVTSTSYDAKGNILTETDANGSVIEYSYDNEDRIISIGEVGAKNTISYTDISESSAYAITTITDANGNLKKEYVDEAGLTTSVIDEDTTTGAKIERKYDYTANGNLAKETYSDGSYLYMEYDQMNRLVKKTSYDSDMAEESVITFTYNAFGDMISVSTVRNGSLVSSYQWTYDKRGNVLTESVTYGEEDPETTTYEYDKDSRLTKTIYPSASNLGTVSYSYDYLGNVTEIKKNGQVVSKYSYDDLYRETSKKDYTNPGIETSFVEKKTTYSDFDKVSEIEYVTNANALVESYEYTYDKVGNILTRVRTKGSEQAETRNYEYSGFYDALTKTTTTKGEETSITTYTYDPVGNRTSMTEEGVTTNYTYNGLNQLVSKTDTAGTTTYNYDAKGNQIEEISPNGTLTFDYLVTGELEEVKSGSLTLQQNSYNHEGIRVSKQEDSKTRTYYYDQGSVAFTLDKGTAQTASTLSTANLRALDGEVIGSFRGEDYYIYTEDIQGSTGKILDDSLSTKNTYSYTDFGEVEVSTNETNGNTISLVENEICYTGAIHDESTGLHYLNARYYDPENGRFISQDTYRGDKNEISQWHLYAYCANNPINYTDPSGHIAIAIPFIPNISIGLINALIALGKAVVVGGIAWIIGTELGDIKKKNKKIYYYAAMIHTDGQVYFGSSLTNSKALYYIKSNHNVLATTAKKAKSLCQKASPIGVAQYEAAHIKKCGYRKHYHPIKNHKKKKNGVYKNRIGGHCFY